MDSIVIHGLMAWPSYLVRSGLRRHNCIDSASSPRARQSRIKARPFPREVFSYRECGGPKRGQNQDGEPGKIREHTDRNKSEGERAGLG